ncbi:fms-related tyrosine kinase 3 ligand [Mantella aurantiaca]
MVAVAVMILICILFDDYEVPLVSNFEQDNNCLVFWQIYDTYTMLRTLKEKAQNDSKKIVESLLVEFSFLEVCSLSVPETCTTQKQPLVQILKKLDSQQLCDIKGDYSSCTLIRCVSGNTIVFNDQPADHHDSVTTNYSTEGQNAGTMPNYEDYLHQKRSEPSNNTATPQTGKIRARKEMITILILLVLLVAVFLIWLQRKLPRVNQREEPPNSGV